MDTSGKYHSWLLAFRPKTLTAAIVPIAVGTALAHRFNHHVHWWSSFWALLSALLIQIGTNLFNDAIDFKKGADTEERVGPQRVTQSGLIDARVVMGGGIFCFVLAVLCGIPLVLQGGWVVFFIGIVSLVCGYAYTGGPFPLAYQGFGDLFVIIFFGLVAVGGVYYLHTGNWDWPAMVAGLQVGFLATVLIAINNFRDMAQDQKVQKKTLAVRWGANFARWEIRLLFAGSFVLLIYWLYAGSWGAGLFPLVLLPFAIGIIQQIGLHEPGPVYNQFLVRAGVIHLLFGLNLSLGLLVL